MLSKKSRPVIGILTGSFISGNRSGLVETTATPSVQFAHKTQSPKGLKKSFDFGAVGLGIVAALEKSGDCRSEMPAALFGRNLSRSNPIPIASPKKKKDRFGSESAEKNESLEEYTIVTRHAANKPYTKVYNCDGRKGDERSPFRIQSGGKSHRAAAVFHISPARLGEPAGAPADDFLSSCQLCQKKLHGEDIYMYRGEKAFCSTECRYRQMVMDERKENMCSSEASRTVDVSSSPYANGQIFTTGILAI